MTGSELSELFTDLGVELLTANRYEPNSLAESDVRRTLYYRRNRREFEDLAARYGPALSLDDAGMDSEAHGRFDVRFLGETLGYGLFASEAVPAGGLVGEYFGVVRPARPGRPLPGGGYSSDYAWGFPKVRSLGRQLEIDARCAGGALRFANHAADPSAIPDHLVLNGRWRIVFVACRDIPAGREITVDYGQAYWSGGDRELVEPVGPEG